MGTLGYASYISRAGLFPCKYLEGAVKEKPLKKAKFKGKEIKFVVFYSLPSLLRIDQRLNSVVYVKVLK